jgi:hypothetical protein
MANILGRIALSAKQDDGYFPFHITVAILPRNERKENPQSKPKLLP